METGRTIFLLLSQQDHRSRVMRGPYRAKSVI